MGKRVDIPYEGLVNIPEAKIGEFEIRHTVYPAGKKIPISSMRTVMYGGHESKPVVYDHDTRWHELLEDGGVWTSDFPIEQYQQRESLKGFRGKVLIGGLGLGVVVQMLTKYKNVSQIDVVEKSLEVCQLVQPYVGDKRMTVYRMDLYDFLRDGGVRRDNRYDHAFFDTWTSDSEFTLYHDVIPLRNLAKPIVKHKITCWNEDIMRGQVHRSIFSPIEFNMAKNVANKAKEKGWKDGPNFDHVKSLEEFASISDDHWWARHAPFYRSIINLGVVLDGDTLTMERLKLLAGRWAYNFDGTDDFIERWNKSVKDSWEFSEPYCRQVLEERQAG